MKRLLPKAAQQASRKKSVTFHLPPAHSNQQFKLIHAWEVRYDPKESEKNLKYDPKDLTPITSDNKPLWFTGDVNTLPLMFPGVRFVVGACGTKFGKTYGCSLRLVKEAWENPGTLNWWVAPTYGQAENAYNFILTLLPKGLHTPYASKLKIEILNPDGTHRSWIEFKSGDKPGNLRGFGVNFFVIDEAVYFDYEAFVSVLTTVTQTGGRGIIISTPQGRTWFYDVYQRGVKEKLLPGEVDEWQEWMAIRLPTWSNPHVPIKNILQAKKNLPDDVFRQEYAAEFLSEGAGVFKNIKGCISGVWMLGGEPVLMGHRYVVGVDLAKLKDYTVIFVIDTSRNHVVYYDRFQGAPWPVVVQRVLEVSRRYNFGKVWIDSTGVGDPIVEDLKNAGCNCEGYKITGTVAKQQLIEKLRVGMEQSKLTFPEIPTLIHELEIYEYEISASGVWKYSAPPGKHDDCVIALALAWWGTDQAPFVYHFQQNRGV
jgi:hypothetical protein